MDSKKKLEQNFERLLFMSRWLLAPLHLGLVIILAMLAFVFLRDLFEAVVKLPEMTDKKIILLVLSMIDLALVGNLLVIVIFSSYENFVSKLDLLDDSFRPAWMGKIDFSGLKIKLVASISAIYMIQLLKRSMEIGADGTDPAQITHEMTWMVIILLTFVVSGVLMALMDWLKDK